jgi:hypothetical protein
VCLAAATTAVHGGLSERVLTTRKLNPTTIAKSRANTVTGVHAATDRSEAPAGAAVTAVSPVGVPPAWPAGALAVAPRGRSITTIAVYRSSAGAMTYLGCTIG